MKRKDIEDLGKKPIALLRVSRDAWNAIADTRRQGVRFSLHFPHETARAGQRGGLVLIATTGSDPALRLGLITSIAATSTFDSRVVFDLVSFAAPGALARLLQSVSAPGLRVPRDRLASGSMQFERVSPKLGAALISAVAEEAENAPSLTRILAHLRRPFRYTNARGLQQDAVALAIKAFGGNDGASSIALPGDDTALATVRVLEDASIEQDARWIPGWRLADSDLTGRATFKRREERLDVFTANKRPLEELFGVDLIYLNKTRGALVMVQYKMLESERRARRRTMDELFGDDGEDEQEWTVRINDQFADELSRMRRFDRDLAPHGPYRLNSGAFFFKLVRRNAATKSAGLLLSLGHLEQLMDGGELNGPAGGLRISYRSLGGHYLRGEGFVELVRSGYIGTRGATTDHLQALVEACLREGKAAVIAIQTALASSSSGRQHLPSRGRNF
jgi:hypothetical protein